MGNILSLSELMSSGKSGSFFYYTADCKIKKEITHDYYVFLFQPNLCLRLFRKVSFSFLGKS